MDIKNLNDLKKKRLQEMIKLSETTNYLIRSGQLMQPELEKLSKEISSIDKQIYDLGEPLIPNAEMRKCPKCKNDVEEGVNFCSKCGTNFTQFYQEKIRICSTCNSTIEVDFTYCPICGTRGAYNVL